MAKLVIKTSGFGGQVIELKLGTNRFGRSSENDFQIEHPTISAHHCEIVLGEEGLFVRDRDSTNGTFIAGEPIKEASLSAGQSLSLGDVEFLVESTDINIAIPKVDVPVAAPPIVLSDGSLLCPRHPEARATHQCTHCLEMLCDACVRRLRRRGGKTLKLCPLCSHPCAPIGGEKRKKKTLLEYLHKTIKLPFLRGSRKEAE